MNMKALRALAVFACALLALALGATMLRLPPPAVRLAPQVDAQLEASGVSHPVTAVLLNFRGYDTLLEIAVLLLAMLGALQAAGHGSPRLVPASPQTVLQAAARLLAPVMVLVAGYLLYAGAHAPGGAFQAAAVLAAALVLLYLAGILPAWTAPAARMRAGLAAGFLIFLAEAALLLPQGAMLQYPPAFAGALILLIESGLSVSLALLLGGMFLWQLREDEDKEAGP